MRLLFICKERLPYNFGPSLGVKQEGSYGLINSCKLVGKYLQKQDSTLEYKVVSVVDNNSIDKEVHLYKPTHVFIEALWVVPEKFEVLLPKYPNVKWAVRIHSKTPFLANEGAAFDWISRYIDIKRKYKNFTLAGNDYEYSTDMNAVYCTYLMENLPNLYPISTKFRFKYQQDTNEINIGCFGALRPMKNQLQQAIAAIMYANALGKHLKFHINGNRAEQKGDQVLKNLIALFDKVPHELVLHGWYPHQEFIELVKTMDVGLQVSFSESFNIVAADFVANDIPIVVSEDIRWASSLYMAETTIADDIMKKIDFAYKWRSFNFQYLNKLGLDKYNIEGAKFWKKYLSK
jgi:hypothetical protein